MSSLTNRILSWHAIFVRVASSLQSAFLLLIRAYWGWQFAQAGWGKLHNIPHVVEFFTNLGIPAPGFNAVLVSSFELVGGILLALGLLSRITALALTRRAASLGRARVSISVTGPLARIVMSASSSIARSRVNEFL